MPNTTNNSPIPESDDPFELVTQWLDDAANSEPNDSTAMALATVDEHGCPNLRMLLLKGLDPIGTSTRGFVFYTNLESTKGLELSTNEHAAMLFHWKSLRRQIRVRGATTPVSAAEADEYFASRPLGSRIGAWASDQSRPLNSREILEQRVEKYSGKFEGGAVPRPPHWSGYRLVPTQIEFWKSGDDRLHHRLLYSREAETAPWSTTCLYP